MNITSEVILSKQSGFECWSPVVIEFCHCTISVIIACKMWNAVLHDNCHHFKAWFWAIKNTFNYLSSKRQRIADAKNMDRIAREMKKVEQQLSVTEEEHEKIKVINSAVKNKLIGEEDKAMSSEETLKVNLLKWLFYKSIVIFMSRQLSACSMEYSVQSITPQRYTNEGSNTSNMTLTMLSYILLMHSQLQEANVIHHNK